MTRATCALLVLLVAACDSTPGGSSSTSSSSTSDSESSSSTTTSEPSTGDESTSTGADTGSTDPTGGPDTTTGGPTPGACPGVTPSSCNSTGEWCIDLVVLCEQIALKDQTPNFCEVLGWTCLQGRIERCDYCAALSEQCTLEGRSPAECTAIEEECACLAGAD